MQLARDTGDDFQALLTRYANERLLYRLSSSRYQSRFVLKGAALFTVWGGTPHRPTRDVDLLGFGNHDESSVRLIFVDILAQQVVADGVTFDVDTIDVAPIREQQAYGGLRAVLMAHIASARVHLQVDIGVGDAITPEVTTVDFPTLLDFPAPRVRAYPPETVVAEKTDAMVRLGIANSRMKDFYDLAVLARRFAFDSAMLVRALRATFERRQTPLPSGLPIALTDVFADDRSKKSQWIAFVKKAGVADAGDLPSTIAKLRAFLEPPLCHAADGRSWKASWPAGGPWSG